MAVRSERPATHLGDRLLPVVCFAILVNDRRVAWEMLGGGFLCFGVLAYKAMPIRRNLLGKAVVGLVLLSAVYFPVMWNSTSSAALPARAVKSQVHPSERDASSDVYRVQENENLELNIMQSRPLRQGLRDQDRLRAPDHGHQPARDSGHPLYPARRSALRADDNGSSRRCGALVLIGGA